MFFNQSGIRGIGTIMPDKNSPTTLKRSKEPMGDKVIKTEM